ncbi:hypothetical protein amrb99_85970 [Actinomadura sp. RB99]|uniref:DUF418 domain-containing protein n=1 Tax=Actinomadura sp. RB99 TaxID=2691577 RepID=UPI001683BEC6|nr:hypothetical protein [Actinomadura sp. RB99]
MRASLQTADVVADERVRTARIGEIDAIRGISLLGITIVNTIGVTNMPVPTGEHQHGAGYWIYETLLHQRFFPIFSLLFGLSFGIILRNARQKKQYPRVMLFSRLLLLLPFGLAHQVLQPNEILRMYSVIGIFVMLPLSFLPASGVLALGIAGTEAAVALRGGALLIPGLLLVGLAMESKIDWLLKLPTKHIFLGLGICGTTAGALDVWQWSSGVSEYSVLAAGAGVATAVSYMIAVVLVMRTRIRRVAIKIALVGRMGLTNYLGASVLIVVINRYVQLEAVPAYGKAFAVGCCVFLIEAALSWIWLHYARYGPLEWIWRALTWEKLIPNRRLSIVGPTSENIG